MHLSRRAEYALLAAIDLAVEGRDERVQLREIAARQAIPEKYLEQLLRPLKTAGVVIATRGSRGGYQLARPAAEVTVLEVLEAVEGPLAADELNGDEAPGTRVVRGFWSQITAGLAEQLAAVTIAQLAREYRADRATSNDWVI